MSSQDLRFDILTLNSGAAASSVRARLADVVSPSVPILVVRRQGIGVVTWYRVGLNQVLAAVSKTDEVRTLSEILTLDSANEVPTIQIAQWADEFAYGVVLLGEEAIAFREGVPEPSASGGRRRRLGSDADSPPKASPPPLRGEPPSPEAPQMAEGAEDGPIRASPGLDSPARVEAPDDEVSSEPPTTGVPTVPGDREDQTFSAFPAIDAPTIVRPDEVFEVAVGVSPEPLRLTTSEGLSVSGLDPSQKTVRFQVLVTGPFEVADDSTNVGDLEVDRETLAHEPFVVRFVAGEPPDSYDPEVGAWTARITAAFFHEGSLVGEGRREIRINQMGGRRISRGSDQVPVEVHSPILDTADQGVDLTISITTEEPGVSGRLRVRLFSRHLPAPLDAGVVNLGEEAKQFAADLIKEVGYNIATPVSDEMLNTIGRVIAETLPDEVARALGTVWDAVSSADGNGSEGRLPDVLILTDDWAVPWELMAISFDDSKPKFLGAQMNVGRWPNRHRQRLTYEVLGVHHLGVMVGHYEGARGVQRLTRAEEEGQKLVEAYEAKAVDADPAGLDCLLRGAYQGFEFEGLHFAGHGVSDPDKGTYLTYSNGNPMTIYALGAAEIAKARNAFLFVNACQVGTADDMLGRYSGLAGMAVEAGFRGFVAPLWSVSDDIAQEISLGLYEASADGKAISSYLREVRGNFRQTEDAPAHTTYLAYVFVGHPALRLGGPDRRSR